MIFEQRIDFGEMKNSIEEIKKEVATIIVGQEKMVELMIAAILADGHVLIEGLPGVAKTLTAKLIAKVISVGFSRIQFTPDLMPSDVLGNLVFNSKEGNFQFKKGPVFSNIILIDEINRAPAKTQAALFEVMEEKQVTMDGVTHPMDQPFLVLATQNPIEHEGTYRLPEAQLDRFLFKIEIDYPNLQEETEIIRRAHERKTNVDLNQVRSLLTAEMIRLFRQKSAEIHIEPSLIEYIAKIVTGTRENKSLYLGASPRASLAMLKSAKAFATLRGRDFVIPEDIQEMAYPVLKHRIQMTPEKEMEGEEIDNVIKQIIHSIEVPR